MSLKRLFSVFVTPQGKDFEYLSQVISYLSQKYSAQSFEPHVTVYSGEYTNSELLKKKVVEALPQIKPFNLEVASVNVSPIYSRTFFIRFKNTQTLDSIYRNLEAAIPNARSYELDPHLSLLYKNTNSKEREALLRESPVDAQSFTFDGIKLVSPNNPIDGWKDTSSWETLLSIQLK